MRFFTYSATDSQGKLSQGTIQAPSSDEARLALSRGGWTVLDVQPASGGVQPASGSVAKANSPNPAQVGQATNRVIPSPQRLNQQTVPQAQIQLNQPGTTTTPQARPAPIKIASAPQQQTIRTRPGSDKQRFFLFSQLAAAFRAGLNPVQVFNEVAQRSSNSFHESLVALANTATEGGSLARTMARYPDLYPEHVVGMTEAGQQGGFLPDAFDQIAIQAQNAHKFKRWFFWIWIVAVNAMLLIPGMWWATRSLLKAYDMIDASGGQGTMAQNTATATNAFWQTLKWPIGPAFLLFCLISWAIYALLGSTLAKGFRHKLGLRAPVYGKRARHENLSIFSWTLARLSNAGLAPANAYRLSAETAPNMEMRDELLAIATRLSGAERMSQIIQGSRLFSEEYAPIIATAEYTGDLSGALQQLSDMSRNEFQTAETYAKMRSGCWGFLALGIAAAIAMGMFIDAWYYELPAKVLKGMDLLM